MPISLKKGQKVSLTKGNPGLKNVVVGLGWDTNAYDTGSDFDLDAAAFCLTDSGKVASQNDFVFFGNLSHPSGAITHLGDNLTGAGDGDDEQIKIDLSKVPAEITKIAFTVTIYEAEARRQNFGQVGRAYVRLYKPGQAEGEGDYIYELNEDFSTSTSVEFCRFYRRNGEWKIQALGIGHKGGLQELLDKYYN